MSEVKSGRISGVHLWRQSPNDTPYSQKKHPKDQAEPSLEDMASNTSGGQSTLESYDEDSPVFIDCEEQGIQTESILEVHEPWIKMREHEKVGHQRSAESAVHLAHQNLLRKQKALSVSCPALDSDAILSVAPSSATNSHLLVEGEDDEGMLHKSMLNLSNTEKMAPLSSQTLSLNGFGHDAEPGSVSYLSDKLGSTSPLPEINVQICINDVSVDNPEDFQTMSEDEEDLNLELIRRQKRRSSWCPEQERKKDEKEEKQRMLGVNGRSQSLSSLEGQDDSDDSDEEPSGSLVTHVSSSKSYMANAATSLTRRDLHVDGSSDHTYTGSSSYDIGDKYGKRSSEPPFSRNLGKHLLAGGNHESDSAISKYSSHSGSEATFLSADDKTVFQVGNNSLRAYVANRFSTKGNSCAPSITQVDSGIVDDNVSPRVQRSGSHSEIFFPKEEKSRRRSSVFSKISSYRSNKKVTKSSKLNWNDHQFVPVSVSNSTSCDVCGKFLSNKPALQCENCAINVHESSCVDQTILCSRIIRIPSKDEPTISRKESNRSEDENSGDVVDGPSRFAFNFISSHFNSHSTESLDDSYTSFAELDEETEALLTEDMAEAWSVTVDKKTLKKMTNKDIKRQDHIWELIQTERNHFRTLKIMQKIFAHGMVKEVGMSKDSVEQIFPRLDDLVEVHSFFLKSFLEHQEKRGDRSIEHFGDLLMHLFQGQTGNQLKSVYGEFCSRNLEAVNAYKDLRKTDRKFQTFIEKCSHRSLCRRLGVDDCILLVVQRLTKYPILIEAILKTTVDAQDKEMLTTSLSLIREIINCVNKQVDSACKHQRFVDILNRLDQKSSTMYRGAKFKKFELLVSERKLHHDGYVKWMSARGKPSEVLAVVLSDIMFFLVESNQKYYFFSQDGKSSVVSLSKLLVREKDDMRDSRGFYLICSSNEPEMYELVCKSTDERSHWIALLKDAITKCSQDDLHEQLPSSHDRFVMNGSSPRKIHQLLDLLQEKDQALAVICKEKTQIVLEILELISKSEDKNKLFDDHSIFDPSVLVNTVLQLETRLVVALKQINTVAGQMTELTCSSCNGSATHKKRAETFSGFEFKNKEVERRRNASGHDYQNETCSVNENGEQSNAAKTVRRASLAISPSPAESSRSSNNTEKSVHRMSVNLLPNMLNKLHREKESLRVTVGDQFAAKSEECVSSSSTQVSQSPNSASWLSALVTDQCESLAQISVHVQSLMVLLSKQSKELKSLCAELNETNQHVSKLSKENDRLLTDRKLTGFQHDKQLEELRNLQSSIEKQKKELLKQQEDQEAELQKERDVLQVQKDHIDKQKTELIRQRENLQQEKDFLQRQHDLFEEKKISTLRSLGAMSPQPHSSQIADQPNSSLTFHGQSEKVTDKHRRIKERGDSFSVLMSNAGAESRFGQRGKRRLSALDSATAGKHGVPATTVQQMFPMKLSTVNSSGRSSQLSHITSKSDKPSSELSKNFSESSLGGGYVQNINSPPMPNHLYPSRSQPQISSQINTVPSYVGLKPSTLSTNVAEKSKSTPTSVHNSPTRLSSSVVSTPQDVASSQASNSLGKNGQKMDTTEFFC